MHLSCLVYFYVIRVLRRLQVQESDIGNKFYSQVIIWKNRFYNQAHFSYYEQEYNSHNFFC